MAMIEASRWSAFRHTGAWALALALAPAAEAITIEPGELTRVEAAHGGQIEHCDEALAAQEFSEAFECGDELFETVFNAVDGAGANVGDGGRFTRVPRADLTGPGQWARHQPARATGPNAASCVACHQGAALGGGGDGPGPVEVNAVRDPLASGSPGQFIQRNTPHLFGPGALQKLGEEMTTELRMRVDAGVKQACATGAPIDVQLAAKGVQFGSLRVDCAGVVSDAGVEGVDPDLIVRPFQWKGVEPTLRGFARGAMHNELGMQAVEIAGEGVDGDFDGVVDEITLDDVTAMALYLAGQPRPVSEVELDHLRGQLAALRRFDLIQELGLPKLSRDEVGAIAAGEDLFAEIGCADCHRPALVIDDPVFSEPSQVVGFRDDPFPAGQPALAQAIRFDLTRDIPENQFAVGSRHFDLGNFERDRRGRAIVRLYGDLKRHEMGPGLAENVDETGHGPSVWMTKELWGVGSSGQFLHDGRATTLTEAILEHGGEAEVSKRAFAALPDREAAQVIRFLDNLVLFFPVPADMVAAQPVKTRPRTFRRRR